MTSEHIRNKFFDRIERIGVRLPDDVRELLFEFAKKNDLLDAEYVKDIVLPFMRSKNGVDIPSKEEWKESIKDNPPYETIPEVAKGLVERCPYHVVDSKGQWYCEIKKIPMEVCMQQFKRFQAMKRRCRPLHRKRRVSTKVNVANVYYPMKEANTEPEGYYCALKGQTFKKLTELPCLSEPMTRCKNRKCEESILLRLKK